MAKINLMPDVKQDKVRAKRRNFMVTLSAIILVAVLIIFTVVLQGYKWAQDYNLQKTKESIDQTKTELAKYKDVEQTVKNIEDGIKAIDTISKNAPRWSLFLPQLEKVTPNDIKFTDFTQTGNTFTAKVEGKDVASIGRLINSLENYQYKGPNDKEGRKLFKNVDVKGYTKDPKGGNYDFSISFEMEGGILW